MATSAAPFVSLPSQGGLNSAAPMTFLAPDELSLAENIVYGLHGERKKRPGFTVANSTANYLVSSSSTVTALAEHWRFGGSLVSSQRFVAAAGSSILASTNGGSTWAALTASSSWGTATNLVTNITIAQGFAVLSNGVDAPVKWDQTTLSTLGASAPIFVAASYHNRRLHTIGTSTEPSRVEISAGGDITLWTGADTMTFQLDEDDGDIGVGITKSFHKRVYVFKGPHQGSIHEIGGNTLATLTHDRVFTGLPLENHKGLVTTPNDIFWISRLGVHSLVTTVNYGDTLAAFLSRPIQDLFDTQLNLSAIDEAVGWWDPLRGLVGWCVRPSGQTANVWALVYHYLLSDASPQGRKYWSVWKLAGSATGYSAAVMQTPDTETIGPSLPRLYLGGTADGTIHKGGQSALTDGRANAAYTARIRTGVLLDLQRAGGPTQEKQFYGVTTFFEPVGSYTHDLNITVDNRQLSTTITMSGVGDTLA